MFISTSSEFITLCRSQVDLLTQSLGAALSVVYLTEELVDGETAQAKLIPVVTYPESTVTWGRQHALALSPEAKSSNTQPLLQPEKSSELSKTAETASAWISCPLPNWNWSTDEEQPGTTDHPLLPSTQIVLPLIHEGVLMGLLVTSREDRPWTERECSEIERIAQTLAIARLLDQRREWFEQQLSKQQRLQAKQQDLLANLLHQFRNPLTALRIFGKLLLKRLLPGDANRSAADGIVRESDRLEDLLKQFDRVIALTTEDIGPQKSLPPATRVALLPNVGTFSITDVLNPLLESAQAIAEERNLNLQINIPPNLPAVKADAKALREVLSNLLDNALKYTPDGGKIHIQAGREQGHFQGIAISDTGPGIPPQDLEQIFERHYRGVQLNSQIPGTGLGLAIAKDLIEQMQGKIQVFSPAQLPLDWVGGPGATFIVWLPVAEQS